MEQTDASFADRRAAMGRAAAALRALRAVLFQCPTGELAPLAGELAELRALAGAALIATVAEADARGVIAESQCASTRAWVADAAWHSRREASTVAKAAALLARPDMSRVSDALGEVELDPATAVDIAAEFDAVAPDLREDALPVVLEQFLEVGAVYGPAGVRNLKEHLLARYGDEGRFDDHAERCRRYVHLSAGRPTIAGLWDYRLTVDGEGRSVLEAAIGPLSAPKPDADSGVRDTRSVGRRRGEALVAALRRSVTAANHVPTSPKATLMVTVDYRALRGEVGVGTVIATCADGTALAPATVRRLACDAAIIPAVLGGDSEILDQGRAERLFTVGQLRALWHRDRHCTFASCDIPGTWCDAHHLIHWADGGPTDLANAVLLCPRHHTIVHRDRLAGRVAGGAIEWDRRPGSYDVVLRARSSAASPHVRVGAATYPRRQ